MIIPHVSHSGVLHCYLIVIYNIFLICSILEYSNPVWSTVFLATIQQDQENSMACTRILYPELSYCQWNSCCYSSLLVPQYQVRLHHVLEDINHNF